MPTTLFGGAGAGARGTLRIATGLAGAGAGVGGVLAPSGVISPSAAGGERPSSRAAATPEAVGTRSRPASAAAGRTGAFSALPLGSTADGGGDNICATALHATTPLAGASTGSLRVSMGALAASLSVASGVGGPVGTAALRLAASTVPLPPTLPPHHTAHGVPAAPRDGSSLTALPPLGAPAVPAASRRGSLPTGRPASAERATPLGTLPPPLGAPAPAPPRSGSLTPERSDSPPLANTSATGGGAGDACPGSGGGADAGDEPEGSGHGEGAHVAAPAHVAGTHVHAEGNPGGRAGQARTHRRPWAEGEDRVTLLRLTEALSAALSAQRGRTISHVPLLCASQLGLIAHTWSLVLLLPVVASPPSVVSTLLRLVGDFHHARRLTSSRRTSGFPSLPSSPSATPPRRSPASPPPPGPTPAGPPLWVTKWVDYSNKYGLGYQLADGTIGVFFNDGTKIALASDGRSARGAHALALRQRGMGRCGREIKLGQCKARVAFFRVSSFGD